MWRAAWNLSDGAGGLRCGGAVDGHIFHRKTSKLSRNLMFARAEHEIHEICGKSLGTNSSSQIGPSAIPLQLNLAGIQLLHVNGRSETADKACRASSQFSPSRTDIPPLFVPLSLQKWTAVKRVMHDSFPTQSVVLAVRYQTREDARGGSIH